MEVWRFRWLAELNGERPGKKAVKIQFSEDLRLSLFSATTRDQGVAIATPCD